MRRRRHHSIFVALAATAWIGCDTTDGDVLKATPMGKGSNLRFEPVEIGGVIYASAYQDDGPFARWDNFQWTEISLTAPDGTPVVPRIAISNGQDGMLVTPAGLYPFSNGVVGDLLPGSSEATRKFPRHFDAVLGAVSRTSLEYFDAGAQMWRPTNATVDSTFLPGPDGRLMVLDFNRLYPIGPADVQPVDELACPLAECQGQIGAVFFLPDGDLVFSTGPFSRFWRRSTSGMIAPIADSDGRLGFNDHSVKMFGEHLIMTQRTNNNADAYVNLSSRPLSRDRFDDWTVVASPLPKLMQAWVTTSRGVILWDGQDGGMYLVAP